MTSEYRADAAVPGTAATPPPDRHPSGSTVDDRAAAPRTADGQRETAPPPGTTGRISGIDAARALAIFGMFAVHLGPAQSDGPLRHVFSIPHGRASLLFMLVAGIGTSLMAGSPHTTRWATRRKLLWRVALLLPLGLALQELDHNVAVILQNYAVLFLLATVLIAMSNRWLLWTSAFFVPVGSALFLWGEIRAPDVFDRAPVALSDPVAEIGHGLLLSGPYPALTWLAPFMLGLWIGRLDLRAPRLRLRLFCWGTAVAVAAYGSSAALTAWPGAPDGSASWGDLLLASPHSQMPLWIVGSTATAVAVLGATSWSVSRASRASWPLVATGQLALTVYVGHLLVLHMMPPAARSTAAALQTLTAFVVVSILASTAWRRWFSRGPLEYLLQPPHPTYRP